MQLMETYTELMAALDDYPDEIARIQSEVTAEKLTIQNAENQMDQIEIAAIRHAGGYNALGSNDGARKQGLAELLSRSAEYLRHQQSMTDAKALLATLSDDLADLERRYGSACYMAQLHGALLTYLGRGGAPVVEMPVPRATLRVDKNGDIEFMPSAQDAEAIGL